MLRNLKTTAGIVMLATLAGPVAAAFKDPLDLPAGMSVKAQSSRLTGIARAGNALVAVGPRGHILRSDDNGKQWRQIAVPLSSDLVSVKFATPEKGWAVGHDGIILHSADGGRSWARQLDGKQAAKLIGEHYGKRAQAGDAEAIKLAADAKRFADEGADKPFLDVLFTDENHGFAVGAFNLAFRTRDGGKTWVPMIERTANAGGLHLYCLTSGDGTVYMAGEQGLIRRWNQEKDRFETIESPYKGSYFGIMVKDAMLIAFGMRGTAYRSADRGLTWKKLDTGVTAGITAGAFLGDGRIALATQAGRIAVSRDGGATFADQQLAKPMPYFYMTPAGADTLAVVGAKGVRIESIK